MSSWNQPEMLWNKHAEIERGGASIPYGYQDHTDVQDGISTGKISDAIDMLVIRMSHLSDCANSQSLPDDEITAELPVLQVTFDKGWGELDGIQTFQYV